MDVWEAIFSVLRLLFDITLKLWTKEFWKANLGAFMTLVKRSWMKLIGSAGVGLVVALVGYIVSLTYWQIIVQSVTAVIFSHFFMTWNQGGLPQAPQQPQAIPQSQGPPQSQVPPLSQGPPQHQDPPQPQDTPQLQADTEPLSRLPIDAGPIGSDSVGINGGGFSSNSSEVFFAQRERITRRQGLRVSEEPPTIGRDSFNISGTLSQVAVGSSHTTFTGCENIIPGYTKKEK